MKPAYKKLLFALSVPILFYGTIHVAHKLLPKWWDIIVGFPLAMVLIFWAAFLYDKVTSNNIPR